ncbi:MAG TPA: fluoride efflux transporter CrcB [Bacteroidia bacterium]|jgi:CrcB protein|nr:fluoride efflux transporter CrcB [Bacteroidia bacterium]
MLKSITLIGLGGAIGSILRFVLTTKIEGRFQPASFPYGTLIINVTGCFAIGLIYALSTKVNIAPEWRGFLATGICGGYTTFSAFSYQNIKLMEEGHLSQAFIYIAVSVLVGLLATFIPILAVQKLS